jgi:hypothetical protein
VPGPMFSRKRPEGPPQWDETDAEVREEAERVWWVHDQFRRLGLSHEDAMLLTFERVDYHELERLLRRGCPKETAFEILR